MKKPKRYVITGYDESGQQVPVMAKVLCETESGPFSTFMAVEAVHGYARNQREEGFTVTVEWLNEVPGELQLWWAQYFQATEGK